MDLETIGGSFHPGGDIIGGGAKAVRVDWATSTLPGLNIPVCEGWGWIGLVLNCPGVGKDWFGSPVGTVVGADIGGQLERAYGWFWIPAGKISLDKLCAVLIKIRAPL